LRGRALLRRHGGVLIREDGRVIAVEAGALAAGSGPNRRELAA
jgi:hypothetical protein